jgi:hypothetical protein
MSNYRRCLFKVKYDIFTHLVDLIAISVHQEGSHRQQQQSAQLNMGRQQKSSRPETNFTYYKRFELTVSMQRKFGIVHHREVVVVTHLLTLWWSLTLNMEAATGGSLNSWHALVPTDYFAPRTPPSQRSGTTGLTTGQDAFRKYTLNHRSNNLSMRSTPRIVWSLCELLRMRV